FATSINNPGQVLAMKNSANEIYLQLFDLFEKEEFIRLLEEGEKYREQFRDDDLLPKIELLLAQARGRVYGFNAYKQDLTQIAQSYPQTEEGRKAHQLLNTTLPQLENSEFKIDSTISNIKLLYRFATVDKQEAMTVKEKIDKAILDVGYAKYSTSIDFYDAETLLLTVHGLENMSRASGFAELLRINTSYNITQEPVIISSENYRVVQLHKNLGTYIELGNNNKQQ